MMCVEETGVSFRAKTGTPWAPLGRTPILPRVSPRRALSTVIGLTRSGRLDTRHFAHAICGEDMVMTLRHVQRHVPGPLILIWDRRNAHRAMVVTAYLGAHPAIEVHWLPPYAPDLNPEEGCHGHVKPHLRNALPGGVSDLRAGVDRGLARLRRRPDLILGCFRHAGLNVNQLG